MRQLRRIIRVNLIRFRREKLPLAMAGLVAIHIGFVAGYLAIAILNQ